MKITSIDQGSIRLEIRTISLSQIILLDDGIQAVHSRVRRPWLFIILYSVHHILESQIQSRRERELVCTLVTSSAKGLSRVANARQNFAAECCVHEMSSNLPNSPVAHNLSFHIKFDCLYCHCCHATPSPPMSAPSPFPLCGGRCPAGYRVPIFQYRLLLIGIL